MQFVNGDKWPGENEIQFTDISISYVQEPDCTEGEDGDPQELILTTRSNGVANFMHLETKGWSFSNIDDLVKLISHFYNKAFK